MKREWPPQGNTPRYIHWQHLVKLFRIKMDGLLCLAPKEIVKIGYIQIVKYFMV